MKLIDTHVHLTNEKYENINGIIKQSQNENIEKMILIGCDKEEIEESIKLARKYPGYLYLALGFHPILAHELIEDDLEWLESKIVENIDIVVAVGEIGLDYYWHPEYKKEQIELFKKQINIAKRLKLPLTIHARDSYDDCYDVLNSEDYLKGIMHSFADDYNSAKRFIDKGMYISISGPVTFKNGHNQKDVVKNIDIDKLLIETDGPYLTPVPFRGQVNYPIYLKYIINEIANIKDLNTEDVAKQILNNTYKALGEL